MLCDSWQVHPALQSSAELNQNQIATLLGLDRTVVHRAIKAMVQEGACVGEKSKIGQSNSHYVDGKRPQIRRKRLIDARIAADHENFKELTRENAQHFFDS